MGIHIIYGSHYGTTERYAKELSRRIGAAAVDYRDMGKISSQDTVVYFGGLYAGGLVGLKKSLPELKTAAKLIVVTVGLADPNQQENVQHIRTSVTKQLGEELSAKTTFVHLRGGIDYERLNVLHRTMMRMLYSQLRKKPSEQLGSEEKELIATYGKKVDFTDLSSVEKIEALLK